MILLIANYSTIHAPIQHSKKTQLTQPTPPETNSSHLKMVVSNRNLLFQRSIFRCYVSFTEGNILNPKKEC